MCTVKVENIDRCPACVHVYTLIIEGQIILRFPSVQFHRLRNTINTSLTIFLENQACGMGRSTLAPDC